MLFVLTFCVFMTFSMLFYVIRLTEKCESSVDESCVHVSKNPVFTAAYILYKVGNISSKSMTLSNQLKKPSMLSVNGIAKHTTEKSVEPKSKGRLFNFSIAPFRENVKPRQSGEADNINKVSPEISISSPVSTDDVYETRRKHLQRVCHRYFDPSGVEKLKKIKLNHVLIDEQHKVLYCYVPKVACTNWKRIFLVLTGKVSNISEVVNLPASHVHGRNLFKSLQNYSVAEIINMTGEYTKFIFVRHPFERLLSAYRNKLEQHYDSSKYFQARFGKYIIRNFRKNPSNVSLSRGDDVTFAEFVRYLLSSDPRHYNEHWQRVTDLCHPCIIEYDFIGKYDTLLRDSNTLLKRFGLGFEFPVMPKPSTTSSSLKRYYAALESSTLYRLYKIYEMDFRLFGYDLFDRLEENRVSSLPIR
ncbi:hypothetical protein RUM44_006260 [Polyplax serrata]|uniref:Carbohydrate sulfotransferase n=1 Tax=Polyplax serrata TaxID=468196 RepID=A0ABR1AHN8_POLSC